MHFLLYTLPYACYNSIVVKEGRYTHMKKNENLITQRIEFYDARIESYELARLGGATTKELASRRKQYSSDKRVMDFLVALENLVFENKIEYYAHDNDNLGAITESIVKSYLKGQAMGMGAVGETDLIQGGRRFDIKMTLKGSTNAASEINLDTQDDVLLITNCGIRIIRKENLEKLVDLGCYKKGTTRMMFKAFNCEYAIETQFTKRLEKELGLNVWL